VVEHRLANLTAAIIRLGNRDELTAPYPGLLNHYGLAEPGSFFVRSVSQRSHVWTTLRP